MHKRLINELTVVLRVEPDGPVLIKAGERGGADPTRPDMEFVRTWHNGRETVYLPGSSLKGVLRAHCEKIARTVARPETLEPMETRLSCNPLLANAEAAEGGCGEKFSRERKKPAAMDAFRRSCFVCQMFGNTELASHVRVSDAYPPAEEVEVHGQPARVVDLANRTEERYGVAIDRVYGSVAVGPFQYETVTRGAFAGTVHIRNFTVAQLGLLGLALRDLREQRVSIGFAKSRGMGRVKVAIASARLRYPLGDLLPGVADQRVVGAGYVLHQIDGEAARRYGYGTNDLVEVDVVDLQDDGWGGLEATFGANDERLDRVWRAAVGAWRGVVQHGR